VNPKERNVFLSGAEPSTSPSEAKIQDRTHHSWLATWSDFCNEHSLAIPFKNVPVHWVDIQDRTYGFHCVNEVAKISDQMV